MQPRNPKKRKRRRRARWDEDDLRKLFVYKKQFEGRNPLALLKPKDCFDLFPSYSPSQIKSFVNGSRYHEYEQERDGIITMRGIVLYKKF